ncbi:type 1 glutamine amidotransferase [Thaumasiovibrio subtropicus]|uniref:type 1 glutamine amidotransferase n=1 Tax=Thaumasiovibrio subtropicus TaxID=1891207 RepID=UPI000B35DFC8|nr:type 1 glutamine amidotransferase [Thaumasiovibrio subtropicus]
MKKIGIILGGDVPSVLTDKHGDYASMLIEKTEIHRQAQCVTYDATLGELPQDLSSYDAFLIGGSPSGVNDGLSWVEGLAEFVRRAQREMKRVAGICFGHQVIHYALGGKVARNAHGWLLGNYTTQHLDSGESLALIAMHQDQVIEAAEGFEVYASADCCPNYCTGYGDQFLTVQGHPEFSAAFFDDFLDVRKGRFNPDLFNRAKASIHMSNDAREVLAKMRAFLLS